jgi:carbon storage regulator CsrA
MTLILARKVNEGIWIGDDVHLFVAEICGDKVRIGFNAPEGIAVLRDELRAAMDKIATAGQDHSLGGVPSTGPHVTHGQPIHTVPLSKIVALQNHLRSRTREIPKEGYAPLVEMARLREAKTVLERIDQIVDESLQ